MVAGDEEIADRRTWLIEQRSRLDAGEATWLAELARFDTSEAWAADAQLSTLSWLMVFCRMSRSTAYEKLKVARQLAHHPRSPPPSTSGQAAGQSSAEDSHFPQHQASRRADALTDLARIATNALQHTQDHH